MNQNISDFDLSPLESVFFSFWHMGQRPLVQGQLILILGAMITAYAIAKIGWWWLRKNYPYAQLFLNHSPRRSPVDFLLWAGHFFLFPSILFLLLLFIHAIYRQYLISQGI